uniref:Uncharacterized protein n=1 Tax=Ascaris lumbricoides TaxID=6252 RepID=A0A0M3I3S0_ASCLU
MKGQAVPGVGFKETAFRSLFQLFVRLCSVVGGVFATSSILNELFEYALWLFGFEACKSNVTKRLQTPTTLKHFEEQKHRIVEA